MGKLSLNQAIKQTGTGIVTLLEHVKRYEPDADSIGVLFDEVTGTWEAVLWRMAMSEDGYRREVIHRVAGGNAVDAAETLIYHVADAGTPPPF